MHRHHTMVDFSAHHAALEAQLIDSSRLPTSTPTTAIADLLGAFQPWSVPQCVGLQVVAPCVPIVQQGILQGLVLPETVLQRITAGDDLQHRQAQAIMIPAPRAIALSEYDNPWAILDQMHREAVDILPVTDGTGHWVGFVERLALQRLLCLEALLQVRQVQEVMVTTLPLMPTTTTLLMAANRLQQTQQPLLLTVAQGSEMGTAMLESLQGVTLWDILRGYGNGQDGEITLIQGNMSRPLVQVAATDSLWSVATQLVAQNSSWAMVLGPEEQVLGFIAWRDILAATDPVALHWQTHGLQRQLHQVTQRTEVLATQLAQTEPCTGRSPCRVLLIEDLAAESLVLQHLLQPPLGSTLTFQVTQMETLAQAIAQLERETYDLIIFDLNLLADGNLGDFTQLQAASNQRPILLLSRDETTQIQLAQECIAQGAQDYLLRSLCEGESQTEREILMRSVRYALETQGIKNRLCQQDQQLQGLSQQLQAEMTAKTAIAHQLETTDAQMKVLFEAITDIVFVINPHTWEIRQVTTPHKHHCQGAVNLCQATHQFLQQHQATLAPYLQQAIAQASPQAAYEPGEAPAPYEYSLPLTPQATPVWFVAKIFALDDQQVVWAAHDISSLKLAQQQLLSDQEHLTAIVQARTQELRALNATLSAEIYQRKGVELALRQEQDFLEALFQLTPALFVVLNPQGQIIRFNPACEQLTGYQFTEVAQRYIWDLFLRDEAAVRQVTAEFQMLLQQQQPRTFEVDWRAKSGKIHRLRWSHAVFLDKRGQVRCVIATGMDMSDRQAFEMTLKTLNQELESRVEQRTRVLEHIEQNLRRQLAAVDAAVDAIAILQQGEFISVNPAFLNLFGYPHLLSLAGQPWHEVLFAPGEQARLDTEILPQLQATQTWQGEAIARRQNGETFTQEISLTITSDADLICVCRDITARNEATQKIRAAEARRRSQYLNFPIPTYTWQHRDGHFYLIDYNSAAEIANQHRLQDFLQHTSQAVYGADHAIHHNICRCFAQKNTFEAELQTPFPASGETFLRYFSVTYVYIEPDLVMVHTQDLTKRKRAEWKLQQSQAFLRQVIDNDPNLIFVKDQNGYFLLANKALANFYGTTVEALLGKRESEIHPQAEAVTYFLAADHQAVLAQKKVVIDETPATDSSGQIHYFRIVKIPLRFGGDRPQYQILGVATDITQQRRAKEELEKALNQERELNDLKTRFIDTASHEFRTPLTVILGAAQILEAYPEQLPQERRSQYLQNIQDSVIRLRQLIDDVLTMSRLEAGKLRCQRQPVDILSLCQDLIAEFKIALGKNHRLLLRTTGAITSPLQLDPTLLQHILSNLLGNACKYSAPGTTVTLELRQTQTAVIFTLKDQGIGIPPEDLPHLFDSFYRASNTQSIPGTGLGLNIVKEYVQLHGGHIELSSQLNRGSQFTVTIPLLPEAVPPEAQ
ncbi:PAS domain S-box protein [Synechococcus moorigangaii CMS01]|nr:PAS domain S-box protein [Synechococcus moorigangaii CMS01]